MGRVFLVTLMFLVLGAPARAQETGRVGLAMGYPAAVGIVWHASPRLAIRPDVTATRTSGESGSNTGGAVSGGDAWTLGVGVSALWYFATEENLRTYLAPRFAYSRSSSDSSSKTGSGYRSETVGTAFSYGASIGAQYALARRFAVYGEIGGQYSDSESTFTSSTSNTEGVTTNKTWGLRSGAGVILYF